MSLTAASAPAGFRSVTLCFSYSTGAVSARNIQLVKKKQTRCQGVVCATKVRAADFYVHTFVFGFFGKMVASTAMPPY